MWLLDLRMRIVMSDMGISLEFIVFIFVSWEELVNEVVDYD